MPEIKGVGPEVTCAEERGFNDLLKNQKTVLQYKLNEFLDFRFMLPLKLK